MRSTVEKEVIIREGKQAIIKSIESGKIKNPQGGPFCFLEIAKGIGQVEGTEGRDKRKGSRQV